MRAGGLSARKGGAMFLFTRRARLVGGKGTQGVEWAAGVCGKVKEITGHEVQLWAHVHSPGFGTISWTSWFDDLASLESVGDALGADASYLELTNAAPSFTEGGLDDGLLQPIHGAPDPKRPVQYVVGVQAVMAAGNLQRAVAAGVEIAEQSESTTGVPTMFLRSLSGPYGAVGWLTGFESIAAVEAATEANDADPAWLKLIDSTAGCFVPDAAVTQQTLYRKLA